MDLGALTQWILAALASCLGGLILVLIQRVMNKLDALDNRFSTVDGFIRTELRTLDVRLSVLENTVNKR